MMRTIFLLCLALAGCFFSHAQTNKYKFNSILQVGIMEGQSGTAASIQIINGVRYNLWSAGIGVGLDYYNMRSVPLFLDLRRNLLKGEKTPFVYLDGGYSLPWTELDGDRVFTRFNSEGGLYYDAGVGYSMPVMKKSALFFTVGYSSKKMSTEQTYINSFSSFVPSTPSFNNYKYTFNRVSLKAGLRF